MPISRCIFCEKCGRPITADQARESYVFPNDGRYVHSACVGRQLQEILELMAKIPCYSTITRRPTKKGRIT